MKKRASLAVDQLLAPHSRLNPRRAAVLEVLCAKVEEYTGRKTAPDSLPRGWFANHEAATLFAITLALLREYHPSLDRERQKGWSDIEKFDLVRAVECLHAVGYPKRAACRMLAPDDKSMYRRYLKFKKEGGWYANKAPADDKVTRFHVEHILKLPLP